jgi:hypothetical protein
MADQDDIDQALRDATPRWAKDGFGLRGPQEEQANIVRRSDQPKGSVDREPRQPAFPPPTDDDPPSVAAVAAQNYNFEMEDASDGDGLKVLIHDGFVSAPGADPIMPSGMGSDDFILPVGGNGYKVWVDATYDTTTLLFTSVSINQGPSIPDSSLGHAFFLLGNIVSEDGRTTTPQNSQCGDINVSFIYGAFNAAPALFLQLQADDPQPIPPP